MRLGIAFESRRFEKLVRAKPITQACALILSQQGRLTQTPYSFRIEQLSFGRAHHDFDASIGTLLFY